MARPERNNVDYFPFYCEEGKKMFYLEEMYGNDGFSTFVKLLRELAKADYHYLDLSNKTTLMFLSAKCKISKETLEKIIQDLVVLEKFDSYLWRENKIIWCQDFIDSIQDAYKKRNNKCITYSGLLTLLVSLGIRKPIKSTSIVPVNPQSKVEYSKVEKIKQLHEKFVDEVKKGGFEERIIGLYVILKIKKGSLTPLLEDYKNHLISENRLHKSTNDLFINFKNWLNKIDQIGKLDKYKTQKIGAL